MTSSITLSFTHSGNWHRSLSLSLYPFHKLCRRSHTVSATLGSANRTPATIKKRSRRELYRFLATGIYTPTSRCRRSALMEAQIKTSLQQTLLPRAAMRIEYAGSVPRRACSHCALH
eukprot:scpid49579/ scgid14728/ 